MFNKIRNFLIIGVFASILAACSTTNLFSGDPTNQIVAIEAGFASIIKVMNEARRPCTTGEGLCLINDELYKKIDPVLQATDRAITTAKEFIASGQVEQAQVWIDKVEESINSLEDFVKLIIELKESAKTIIGGK